MGRCLASWIKVWAVQALQWYGFPFFVHMSVGVGRVRVFIGRWRLFSFVFEEVTVGVGKVLELLNDVQSGFRLRLVQVEFCKKVFPF